MATPPDLGVPRGGVHTSRVAHPLGGDCRVDLSTLEYGHAGSTPDHDSEGAALNLGSLSPQVYEQVLDRLLSKDFGAWADTLARAGNCVHLIRLRGTFERIDPATGEVLSCFSSADQPLGL